MLIHKAYVIIQAFLIQSKDRTILHAEVLKEYNKNFVNPLVSVTKRDVATSTSPGNDHAVTAYKFSYLPNALSNMKRSHSVYSKRTSQPPETMKSPFVSQSLMKTLYPKGNEMLKGGKDFPLSPSKVQPRRHGEPSM